MNSIQCRKCNVKKVFTSGIVSSEREYPNGILCLDCWSNKSKGKSTFTSFSKTSSNGSSSFPSKANDIVLKYEVGDSVFINTDKYGVLLCQIIDSEAYDANNIFYTLDAKGSPVSYIDELEVFDTAIDAKNSKTVKL